jgi:hypothetical protein
MHLAAGTHAGHGAILGDLAVHSQIDDLTALGQDLDSRLGAVVPAAAKPLQEQNDPMLGILDQCSACAGMTLPAAGLLAAAHAARARRRFLERRIRGRGGLLELELSLAKRASSARMRWSGSAI